MRHRRTVEELEFVPPQVDAVVARMDLLAAAGDGWLNLLPGVPEDAVEEPPRTVFTALFGAVTPPVTMCTYVPGRRGSAATVGISHAHGRFAARQLAELGAPIPTGWTVRQDHARRGLVVRLPPTAEHAAVLDWMLRAGRALAMVPLTGSWLARVHLPLPGQGEARSTTS